MGATEITVAERSGPGDPTRVVMKNKGILALAAELDFNILAMERNAGRRMGAHTS